MEQAKFLNNSAFTPFFPIYFNGKISINRGIVYNTMRWSNYVVPKIDGTELEDFNSENFIPSLDASGNGVVYVEISSYADANEFQNYVIDSAEIKFASSLPKSSWDSIKVLICEVRISNGNVKLSKITRSDIPIWNAKQYKLRDSTERSSLIEEITNLSKDVTMGSVSATREGLADIELDYICQPNGMTDLKGKLEVICKSKTYNIDASAYGINIAEEDDQDDIIIQEGEKITSFSSTDGTIERHSVTFS